IDLGTQSKFMPYRPIGKTDSSIGRPSYHYDGSPDGKYRIDLIQRRDGGLDLYLINLRAEHSTLVQSKALVLLSLAWSADSARLALLWFNGSMYSISVVEVDTGESHGIFQNSIAPTLLKWSADHLYLAMSVHSSSNGSNLQLWSEQGLIALRPHTNIYDSFQG